MIVIKGKGKSKGLKIFAIVLVVIIALAVVLFMWQRNNIKAVVEATKYSDEDIQQQITDNKKVVENQLEQYEVTGLRDFTPEEEEAIRKGQITVEEAMAKIVGESSESSNNTAETGGTTNSSNGEATSGEKTASSIVSDYTVRLYTLKATYLGQIGNLIDQAKADYKSGTSATTLMSKYLGQAASLEAETDSKVNALLNELKGELTAVGADTSIINTMKESYNNEKTLKKSYYLSLFNKKK